MKKTSILGLLKTAARMLVATVVVAPVIASAQGTTPQVITAFNPTTPISFSNGATIALAATGGGSTNPVVFGSNTTSVCTVSGATVSVLSVGNCVLTANQAGDATYAAAAEVQKTVVINKGSQTISFAALVNRTMVPATFDLTATASSGLPISYTTTTSTKCTISGVTVTLVSTGTCVVTANQAGNSNFNAATSVAQSFTISLEPQTINFPTIGPKFILDSPLTLNATASSGLAITFSTNTPAVCSVSGNTATLSAPGTCNLYATQSGNSSYASMQVLQQVSVSKTNQTISFPAIGNKFILDSPITLSATASSGLPVTFTTNTPAVCSTSGNVATLSAPGTCNLYANQAGNAAYNSVQVLQQIAVSKTNQTINFPAIGNKFILDSPLTLSATASSGLPVTFTTNTPAVCSISGNLATLSAAGTCNIYANQVGNTAYNSIQVLQQVNVSKSSQTITFGAIAQQIMPTQTLTLSATASSGLAVTYSSTTTTICTVSGSTVTFVNPGTCTINATQPGNAAYNAATQVTQSFSIVKANQTITFGAIASQPFGTAIPLTGNTSSGLTIAYTSSTTSVCTVSGATVTPVGVGVCTINANQAGNSAYNAAAQVTQSFSIVKGDQSINFNAIANQPLNSSPTLSASASSGLAVALTTSTPTVCTVSGTNATLLALGTCTINANQAGTANYNAAAQVSQSFVITQGTQTITGFAPTSPTAYRPNGTFSLSATGGASGNPVTFASTSPTICTVSGSTATILTVGTCSLTANQAGNSNYLAATEVSASVTITQAAQSISVYYPTSGLVAGGTAQLTATGGASPNLVTFTSGSPSICTVGTSSAGSGGTSVASLSVLAAGDCQLTANQAGDTLYSAAPPVAFTLTIGAGSQIFYVHTDHLGTPRAITQAAGNGKVWEWKNDDPFGNNAPDENPSGIAGTFKYNLRLPGQYYDQETGTYYNYFRDYDPSIGRYVQSDPIGQMGGTSLYSYVTSDPIGKVDPNGLFGIPGAIAGAIVGGIGGGFGAAATGGNIWLGIGLGALGGGVVGGLGPLIGPSLLGQVAVRMAASGLGNILGQSQNVGSPCYRGPNLGSLLGSVAGGAFAGLIAPATYGTQFLGPIGTQVIQRGIAGIPGSGISTTSSVLGNVVGSNTEKCECAVK